MFLHKINIVTFQQNPDILAFILRFKASIVFMFFACISNYKFHSALINYIQLSGVDNLADLHNRCHILAILQTLRRTLHNLHVVRFPFLNVRAKIYNIYV